MRHLHLPMQPHGGGWRRPGRQNQGENPASAGETNWFYTRGEQGGGAAWLCHSSRRGSEALPPPTQACPATFPSVEQAKQRIQLFFPST